MAFSSPRCGQKLCAFRAKWWAYFASENLQQWTCHEFMKCIPMCFCPAVFRKYCINPTVFRKTWFPGSLSFGTLTLLWQKGFRSPSCKHKWCFTLPCFLTTAALFCVRHQQMKCSEHFRFHLWTTEVNQCNFLPRKAWNVPLKWKDLYLTLWL